MKYDIFVSYRRSDAFTANLVAEKLKALGYSVFFDVETLRGGVFNEQLYEVIRNCKDVVLVLPPDGLDRCVSKEDWIRKEICYAMECKKNIIPVLLTGFDWPTPMPEGMEQLKFYQAVTATSAEYFDMSIKKLASYLKSKPTVKRKLVTKLYVIALSILTLVFIGWIIWRFTIFGVCNDITHKFSHDISIVDLLYEQTERLDKAWEDYKTETLSNNDLMVQKNIDSLSIERVSTLRSDVEKYTKLLLMDSTFTKIQVIVCARYNIPEADLIATLPTLQWHINEYIHTCDLILNYIKTSGPLKINDLKVGMNIDMAYPCYNSTFYNYLATLSSFPKSTIKSYRQYTDAWVNFNTSGGMKLTPEEYMSAANQEINKAEAIFSNYKDKIANAKLEQK